MQREPPGYSILGMSSSDRLIEATEGCQLWSVTDSRRRYASFSRSQSGIEHNFSTPWERTKISGKSRASFLSPSVTKGIPVRNCNQACTFHNPDGAVACDMCGTPNPKAAGGAGGGDEDGSAAYWSCQVRKHSKEYRQPYISCSTDNSRPKRKK